jgi:hypothetical protein
MAKEKKKQEEAFDPDKYLSETKESFDPDKYLSETTAPEISKTEARLTGLGQGATLGYLPEITALIEKAAKPVYEYATDSVVPESSFEESKKYYQKEYAKAKEAQPSAYAQGELASILSPLPGGAIVKAASKLGKGIKGTSIAAKAARSAVSGAAGGAAFGALTNISPEAQEEGITGQIKERAKGALTGAAFGGGLGAGIPGALSAIGSIAKKGSEVTKKALKKAGSVFGGVNEKNIERYLANPDRIDNAKSVEDLKEIVDEAVSKVKEDVLNAELTKNQASASLDLATKQIQDAAKRKKLDVSEALRDSKASLNEAFRIKKQEVKDARIPHGFQNEVASALEDLKGLVIKESDESYKILEAAKKNININKVKEEVARQRSALRLGEGQDITAYHGTFENFKPSDIRPSKKGTFGKGIYLSTNKKDVFNYGDKVLEYKFKKPKLFDLTSPNSEETKKFAEKYGFDLSKKKFKDNWSEMMSSVREKFPDEDLTGSSAVDKIHDLMKKEGFDGIKFSQNSSNDNMVLFDEGSLSAKSMAGELFGSSAKEADARLLEVENLLNKMPEEASPSVIKNIIQRLDKEVNYGRGYGEFGDESSNALKSVRRSFDTAIKEEIPEYAAKMESLAPKTELLSEASKKFGTNEKIISKLSSIDKPNLQLERDLLGRLAANTKRDLMTPIESMMALKQKYAGPLGEKAMRKELPEYQDYIKQVIESRKLRPDLAQEAQDQLIKGLPEQQRLIQAESALAAQEAKYAPIKRITPESSEAKIKSLMSERSIENKKAMEALSNLTDMDFNAMIQDASVKAAFEKGATQGSRNVNMWTLLVSGGLTGGGEAAVAGAMIGAAVDKYGPAMTKQVLKGISKIQGMPTVQKIRQMNIPPEVQEELINQLRDFSIRYREIKNLPVNPQDIEQTKKDVQSSRMNTIEKAKNINSLNKEGVLLDPNKVMEDGSESIEDILKKKAKGA